MTIVQYLQSEPGAFVAAAVVFGLIVGSFLNVVILRLPVVLERDWRAQCAELMELPEQTPKVDEPFNLVVPRSRCPHCGHRISALENVPLLSYAILGGKCAECRRPISIRYPIVEALAGVLAGIVAWRFGFGAAALGALVLSWALIALTFIDLDHQLLPDVITLPFMWLGLLLNLFGVYTTIQSSVVGAMVGYLVLWGIYHAFRLLTGKEGMGHGDFKLLALVGAWLGWQALPFTILASSVIGAGVGLMMILFRGQGRETPIPFGPYLAAAGWVALLWGNDITQWYLGRGTVG